MRVELQDRLGSPRVCVSAFLGSTGCQPVGLGSLPRPRVTAWFELRASRDVAGRAAGNYRLAACAPQKRAPGKTGD